jgi:cell shape-determining protein MreC
MAQTNEKIVYITNNRTVKIVDSTRENKFLVGLHGPSVHVAASSNEEAMEQAALNNQFMKNLKTFAEAARHEYEETKKEEYEDKMNEVESIEEKFVQLRQSLLEKKDQQVTNDTPPGTVFTFKKLVGRDAKLIS